MYNFLEELCALCMLWSTATQQFQQSCSTVAAEAGESKAARLKRAVQTQANLCSRGNGFAVSDSCSLPMWHYISRRHGDTLSVVLCISFLSWPSKETKKNIKCIKLLKHQIAFANTSTPGCAVCVCCFDYKNRADLVAVTLAWIIFNKN